LKSWSSTLGLKHVSHGLWRMFTWRFLLYSKYYDSSYICIQLLVRLSGFLRWMHVVLYSVSYGFSKTCLCMEDLVLCQATWSKCGEVWVEQTQWKICLIFACFKGNLVSDLLINAVTHINDWLVCGNLVHVSHESWSWLQIQVFWCKDLLEFGTHPGNSI
jgi:hypothetical protein